MSFVAELKRRNVFKVGAAYAVVAWVVMQAVDIVLPTFDAPRWVNQTLLFLIILGFPVALVLAWAFEMTPDGIKAADAVPPADSTRPKTASKLNYVIIGGLVVVLALVVLDAYVLTDAVEVEQLRLADTVAEPAADAVSPAAAASTEQTLAVLPFENLSSDPEQEYFSDGLTEELLNQLAQVKGLQITGRTSSFSFKNSDADAKTIGETLGVAHILTGSVRKAGNEVRVSAELTTSADGVVLWTDSYDRELTDIFAIQDDIAASVTTALSVTMGAGDFGLPGMTRNIEAYDAYLRGMQHFRAFSGSEALMAAIDEFERAVNIDPAFARAWIKLASVLASSTQFLTEEQRTGFAARIAEAHEQVRVVVPDMPDLHLLKAAELIQQRELVAAEAEYLLYQEQTRTVDGASLYGRFLLGVGRSHDALPYLQEARRLEPLGADNSLFLAIGLQYLGRLQEVESEIERGLALDGLDEFIEGQRVLLAFNTGDRAGALRAVEQMNTSFAYNLPLAQAWLADDRESGLALIREQMETPLNDAAKVVLAQWAAVLGDNQLSLELRRMSTELANNTISIWMPYYSAQRQDPAFKDFMRDIGLLDYWRSSGNWSDYCRPVNDDFECF